MSDTDPQHVLLGRQAVLDRNQHLFAYALSFRAVGTGDNEDDAGKESTPPTPATIVETVLEFSLEKALGACRGFVNAGRDLLFCDRIDALPRKTMVLDVDEDIAVQKDVIERCTQLHDQGFALALKVKADTLVVDAPLFRRAQFIRVDIADQHREDLQPLINRLRPFDKTLLAERVERQEQMLFAQTLGFELFQGAYYAHPNIMANKPLHPSLLSLLDLIALLNQDADTREMEHVFKQEPLLTLNLLRLTNSASSGMSTRITSINHAISLLGRRQILRWLQLLMYSSASDTGQAANPLLQLAATRGRLLELLVDKTPQVVAGGRELIDQAYMVGILSLMPCLMGKSIEEALVRLPVTEQVHAALSQHQGVLGDLLRLIEALEDPENPGELCLATRLLRHYPQITVHYANSCLARALTWANGLAQESILPKKAAAPSPPTP